MANKKNKKKERKQSDFNIAVWSSAICNLIVAIAVILGLFIADPIKQFDFEIGDIATETIYATRDIEDEFVTNQLIEEAKKAVQDIYIIDDAKTSSIYELVNKGALTAETIYNSAIAHFADWKQDRLNSLEYPGEPDPDWEDDSQELEDYNEKLADYNSKYDFFSKMTYSDVLRDSQLFAEVFPDTYFNSLGIETEFVFTPAQMKVIVTATENQIALIKNNLPELVRAELVNRGIRENEIQDALNEIRQQLVLSFNDDMMGVIDSLLSNVSFNVVLDVYSTEEARRIAGEAVNPVIYKKGQTIVTAGQPITEAQYRLIEQLGLLSSGANEYSNYISMSIAILLICGIQCLVFISHKRSVVMSIKNNIMIALLIVVSMYLYIFVKNQNEYICTSLLAVIMLTLLLDGRSALIVGVGLSFFCGIYASGNFAVTLVSCVGCIMCSCMLKRESSSRSIIILLGLASALAELIMAVAMEYYLTAKFAMVGINAFWIMLGGAAAAILATGLLSVFENIFGIITPIRLLEISNQSQPLLKRLQIEATGTYHHSIMVGNMAETAANDVGADGLLARIGSYYHDIGKLMRPQMFKENQPDDFNPHAELPPEVSAKIIIAHVKDGLYLADEYKLPKILYQFIEEHHGSSIAAYFYYEACNLYGKENVNVEDYKYSGKTPATKECAIVMMADTVEAAVRSMKTHSTDEMRETIDKLIDTKIDAGQLNNCPLTFKEISVIKKSFLTILSGVYHQRVEYPKLKENNDEQTNKA